MSEGPTSVGSIKGNVEIDIADALAKLAAVKRAANNLGGRDSTIRVDTKDAVRETENLEKSTRKLGNTAAGAAKQQADWRATAIAGLVAISAAMPPVAAGAVGITGALGLMGVAGGLAVAGIARAMKDGTGAGVAYTGMVKTLQGNIHALQDSAAKGLLPGFQATVTRLQTAMPMLNSVTREFAGRLGAIAPTGLDAVIHLIENGLPAFRAGADLIGRLVKNIDSFAGGQGYKDFIAYTVQNMPMVESFLNQVFNLAGDLLKAWAPLGSVALPALTDLLGAIDLLVRHTGPLVPAAIFLVAAFKGLSPVIGIVRTLAAELGLMGDAAVVAGTKVVAAEQAATIAGGAGGKVGLLSKLGGAKGLGLTAAGLLAGGFIAAGTDGKGGLNGDLQGIGGGALAGASVGRYFGAPGVIVGTVVGATAGSIYANRNNPGGGKTAGAQTATYGASWNGYQGAAPKNTGTSTPMGGGDTSYGGFGASATAANASTAATKNNTAALAANAAAQRAQAAAAASAARSQQILAGASDATATASHNLVLSENAASDALIASGAALKQNKGAWSSHTAAGMADRDAVAAAVDAIHAHAAAINADGKNVAAAKMYTDQHILALKNQARQAGVSGKDIDGYIAHLLGVPKSVVSKITADSVQAEKTVAQAKAFAKDYARGDYKGIMRGDYTPAQKAAAEAASGARGFANGHYSARLLADASRALAAARQTVAAINAMTASIRVSVTAVGGNGAQVARNYLQGAGRSFAIGGTAGMAQGGSGFPGLAGGSVSGPGTAATDTAGLYRLANGEEVISNLFGQADRWRPLLKAINSNRLDGRFLDRMTQMARPQVTIRTIQPEVHIHNPVAVDPVAQAAEAAQLALAAAGIG